MRKLRSNALHKLHVDVLTGAIGFSHTNMLDPTIPPCNLKCQTAQKMIVGWAQSTCCKYPECSNPCYPLLHVLRDRGSTQAPQTSFSGRRSRTDAHAELTWSLTRCKRHASDKRVASQVRSCTYACPRVLIDFSYITSFYLVEVFAF